jgi:hypothetical protein
MMYQAIKQLFPGIADSEFTLQDDGKGPYIARWDRPEPQPTAEELAAVVVPPTVPAEVPLQKARRILRKKGKMDAVKALIAQLPEAQRIDAEEMLEYSSFMERDNPFVNQIGAALGIDIDAWFIEADALS